MACSMAMLVYYRLACILVLSHILPIVLLCWYLGSYSLIAKTPRSSETISQHFCLVLNKSHHLSLVGGLNPSEKYQSIGMIIPNIWENKIHVPNHQPATSETETVQALHRQSQKVKNQFRAAESYRKFNRMIHQTALSRPNHVYNKSNRVAEFLSIQLP